MVGTFYATCPVTGFPCPYLGLGEHCFLDEKFVLSSVTSPLRQPWFLNSHKILYCTVYQKRDRLY